MKARTLSIALIAVLAASAHAQTGNAAKPIPMPATSPVAAPAPANLLPPPPVGAAPAPAAVSSGPRNPLKPPAPAAAPAVPAQPVVAPTAQPLPSPGLPLPTMGRGQLPGMPVDAPAPDEDPVKANGKRIGKLNGKAIFKHEEAYYFDSETEKPKK